jgi:hypothetical protein
MVLAFNGSAMQALERVYLNLMVYSKAYITTAWLLEALRQ